MIYDTRNEVCGQGVAIFAIVGAVTDATFTPLYERYDAYSAPYLKYANAFFAPNATDVFRAVISIGADGDT